MSPDPARSDSRSDGSRVAASRGANALEARLGLGMLRDCRRQRARQLCSSLLPDRWRLATREATAWGANNDLPDPTMPIVQFAVEHVP